MVKPDLKEEFISVFEENIGIILKISRVYAQTKQDREDLLNDIALELWKSYPRFKSNSKVSTWIYRVSLNTSMNYKRRASAGKTSVNEAIEIDYSDRLTENDANSLIDALYDCIADLDEFNKAIIILYLDGNTHEEISQITGISKSNVGTRISRIKEQLRSIASDKL
jgi:RNA polymerase sigma-70 factor (ECF subfamily)